MVITLLGTGTGVPSQYKNPPCIAVNLSGKNAIFDSGPGTLKNLLKLGVDCLNLDFIFYSHLHLDHVSDLAAILFAARIPPSLRDKELTVYGPRGLIEYYNKLKDLYKETVCPDRYKLNLEEIENKKIEVAGYKISTRTLNHHGGGMGYRLVTPSNKIMVYSGDTDLCDELMELSSQADILILECSTPDEMKMKGHLTPTGAGKVARQSNAKKLVLVHMYPVCERYDLIGSCRKEFNGKIVVGEDLMRFELN